MKWFKKLISATPPRIPMPGEHWIMKHEQADPWPKPEQGRTVRIIDVKDGWVRYYMGTVFSDERLTMQSFLYIYKFHCVVDNPYPDPTLSPMPDERSITSGEIPK